MVKLKSERDTEYMYHTQVELIDPSLGVVEIRQQIDTAAAQGGGAEDLTKWLVARYGGGDGSNTTQRSNALEVWAKTVHARSRYWGEMEIKDFKTSKGASFIHVFPNAAPAGLTQEEFKAEKLEHSLLTIAAKGLLGWSETHQGVEAVESNFRLQNFNEWTFLGDVRSGVIVTYE